VKDINPGSGSSVPGSFARFKGKAFFTTHKPLHGSTRNLLWKSDGTASGTQLVKRIGSALGTQIRELTPAGKSLFFASNAGALWKTNGTSAGTVSLLNKYPTNLTNVGGKLFFVVGCKLWKSNGTSGGTTPIKSIPCRATSSPDFTNVSGTLFFSVGNRLFKSDGTATGTKVVKTVGPYWTNLYELTAVGDTLFFDGNDGIHGYELWKSNGTASGTQLVRDLGNDCSECSGPSRLTNVGGTLFFISPPTAAPPGIWRSDGSAAGTQLVHSYPPYYARFGNVGGSLYFAGRGPSSTELWKSDGTETGTHFVGDLGVPDDSGYPYPDLIMSVGSTAFIRVVGRHVDGQLWVSDGGSTQFLKTFQELGSSGSTPKVAGFVNVAGHLFFGATSASNGVGNELWEATP
jgi:ELWxxDGT repeat protein